MAKEFFKLPSPDRIWITNKNEVDKDISYQGNYQNRYSWGSLENTRAANQPWYAKLGNGVTRLGLTTGTKLVGATANLFAAAAGIGAGTVGVAMGEDFSQGFDWAMDNIISNGIDSMEESVKDNFIIHSGDAYNSGSVFDKMGTAKFWAEDSIDGIAFAASAYIGGGGLAKIISKAPAFAKVAEWEKALLTGDKLNIVQKALATVGADKLGVVQIGLLNSASEAMFEAHEAAKESEKDLIKKVEEGKLSLTADEIKQRKGEVGAATFKTNMALLALTNQMESFLHLGTFRKYRTGAAEIERRVMDASTTQMRLINAFERSVDEGKALMESLGTNIGRRSVWDAAKRGIKGVAMEGFLEENAQTNISNYLKDKFSAQKVDEKPYLYDMFNVVGDVLKGTVIGAKGFASMLPGKQFEDEFDVNTRNAEIFTSIFLGGLIGGPMNIALGGKDFKNTIAEELGGKSAYERLMKSSAEFRNLIRNSHGQFIETDANGKMTINKERVQQAVNAIGNKGAAYEMAMKALNSNDAIAFEAAQQLSAAQTLHNLSTNFKDDSGSFEEFELKHLFHLALQDKEDTEEGESINLYTQHLKKSFEALKDARTTIKDRLLAPQMMLNKRKEFLAKNFAVTDTMSEDEKAKVLKDKKEAEDELKILEYALNTFENKATKNLFIGRLLGDFYEGKGETELAKPFREQEALWSSASTSKRMEYNALKQHLDSKLADMANLEDKNESEDLLRQYFNENSKDTLFERYYADVKRYFKYGLESEALVEETNALNKLKSEADLEVDTVKKKELQDKADALEETLNAKREALDKEAFYLKTYGIRDEDTYIRNETDTIDVFRDVSDIVANPVTKENEKHLKGITFSDKTETIATRLMGVRSMLYSREKFLNTTIDNLNRLVQEAMVKQSELDALIEQLREDFYTKNLTPEEKLALIEEITIAKDAVVEQLNQIQELKNAVLSGIKAMSKVQGSRKLLNTVIEDYKDIAVNVTKALSYRPYAERGINDIELLDEDEYHEIDLTSIIAEKNADLAELDSMISKDMDSLDELMYNQLHTAGAQIDSSKFNNATLWKESLSITIAESIRELMDAINEYANTNLNVNNGLSLVELFNKIDRLSTLVNLGDTATEEDKAEIETLKSIIYRGDSLSTIPSIIEDFIKLREQLVIAKGIIKYNKSFRDKSMDVEVIENMFKGIQFHINQVASARQDLLLKEANYIANYASQFVLKLITIPNILDNLSDSLKADIAALQDLSVLGIDGYGILKAIIAQLTEAQRTQAKKLLTTFSNFSIDDHFEEVKDITLELDSTVLNGVSTVDSTGKALPEKEVNARQALLDAYVQFTKVFDWNIYIGELERIKLLKHYNESKITDMINRAKRHLKLSKETLLDRHINNMLEVGLSVEAYNKIYEDLEKVADKFPTFQQILNTDYIINSLLSSDNEALVLLGLAGTGKTSQIVRRVYNYLKESKKIAIFGHTQNSANVLAEGLGLGVNELTAFSESDLFDNIESIRDADIIMIDEAFAMSTGQSKALVSLKEYAAAKGKKIVLLGDNTQYINDPYRTASDVLSSFGKFNVIDILRFNYRLNVLSIEDAANHFRISDKSDYPESLKSSVINVLEATTAMKSIKKPIGILNVDSNENIDTIIDSSIGNGRSKLIIVDTVEKYNAYTAKYNDPSVKVIYYNEAGGLTFDEVYIDIYTGAANTHPATIEKRNSLLYTLITRAKDFVVVSGFNSTMTKMEVKDINKDDVDLSKEKGLNKSLFDMHKRAFNGGEAYSASTGTTDDTEEEEESVSTTSNTSSTNSTNSTNNTGSNITQSFENNNFRNPWLKKAMFFIAMKNGQFGISNEDKAFIESNEQAFRDAYIKRLASVSQSQFTIKEFLNNKAVQNELSFIQRNLLKLLDDMGMINDTIPIFISDNYSILKYLGVDKDTVSGANAMFLSGPNVIVAKELTVASIMSIFHEILHANLRKPLHQIIDGNLSNRDLALYRADDKNPNKEQLFSGESLKAMKSFLAKIRKIAKEGDADNQAIKTLNFILTNYGNSSDQRLVEELIIQVLEKQYLSEYLDSIPFTRSKKKNNSMSLLDSLIDIMKDIYNSLFGSTVTKGSVLDAALKQYLLYADRVGELESEFMEDHHEMDKNGLTSSTYDLVYLPEEFFNEIKNNIQPPSTPPPANSTTSSGTTTTNNNNSNTDTANTTNNTSNREIEHTPLNEPGVMFTKEEKDVSEAHIQSQDDGSKDIVVKVGDVIGIRDSAEATIGRITSIKRHRFRDEENFKNIQYYVFEVESIEFENGKFVTKNKTINSYKKNFLYGENRDMSKGIVFSKKEDVIKQKMIILENKLANYKGANWDGSWTSRITATEKELNELSEYLRNQSSNDPMNTPSNTLNPNAFQNAIEPSLELSLDTNILDEDKGVFISLKGINDSERNKRAGNDTSYYLYQIGEIPLPEYRTINKKQVKLLNNAVNKEGDIHIIADNNGQKTSIAYVKNKDIASLLLAEGEVLTKDIPLRLSDAVEIQDLIIKLDRNNIISGEAILDNLKDVARALAVAKNTNKSMDLSFSINHKRYSLKQGDKLVNKVGSVIEMYDKNGIVPTQYLFLEFLNPFDLQYSGLSHIMEAQWNGLTDKLDAFRELGITSFNDENLFSFLRFIIKRNKTYPNLIVHSDSQGWLIDYTRFSEEEKAILNRHVSSFKGNNVLSNLNKVFNLYNGVSDKYKRRTLSDVLENALRLKSSKEEARRFIEEFNDASTNFKTSNLKEFSFIFRNQTNEIFTQVKLKKVNDGYEFSLFDDNGLQVYQLDKLGMISLVYDKEGGIKYIASPFALYETKSNQDGSYQRITYKSIDMEKSPLMKAMNTFAYMNKRTEPSLLKEESTVSDKTKDFAITPSPSKSYLEKQDFWDERVLDYFEDLFNQILDIDNARRTFYGNDESLKLINNLEIAYFSNKGENARERGKYLTYLSNIFKKENHRNVLDLVEAFPFALRVKTPSKENDYLITNEEGNIVLNRKNPALRRKIGAWLSDLGVQKTYTEDQYNHLEGIMNRAFESLNKSNIFIYNIKKSIPEPTLQGMGMLFNLLSHTGYKITYSEILDKLNTIKRDKNIYDDAETLIDRLQSDLRDNFKLFPLTKNDYHYGLTYENVNDNMNEALEIARTPAYNVNSIVIPHIRLNPKVSTQSNPTVNEVEAIEVVNYDTLGNIGKEEEDALADLYDLNRPMPYKRNLGNKISKAEATRLIKELNKYVPLKSKLSLFFKRMLNKIGLLSNEKLNEYSNSIKPIVTILSQIEYNKRFKESSWGAYVNGQIFLKEVNGEVYDNVLRHEYMHFISRNLLDNKMRNKLYNAAALHLKNTYNLDVSQLSDEVKEEVVADLFYSYMQNKPTFIKGLLKSYFDMFKELIGFTTEYGSDIESLFNRVTSGAYNQGIAILSDDILNMDEAIKDVNDLIKFGNIENENDFIIASKAFKQEIDRYNRVGIDVMDNELFDRFLIPEMSNETLLNDFLKERFNTVDKFLGELNKEYEKLLNPTTGKPDMREINAKAAEIKYTKTHLEGLRILVDNYKIQTYLQSLINPIMYETEADSLEDLNEEEGNLKEETMRSDSMSAFNSMVESLKMDLSFIPLRQANISLNRVLQYDANGDDTYYSFRVVFSALRKTLGYVDWTAINENTDIEEILNQIEKDGFGNLRNDISVIDKYIISYVIRKIKETRLGTVSMYTKYKPNSVEVLEKPRIYAPKAQEFSLKDNGITYYKYINPDKEKSSTFTEEFIKVDVMGIARKQIQNVDEANAAFKRTIGSYLKDDIEKYVIKLNRLVRLVSDYKNTGSGESLKALTDYMNENFPEGAFIPMNITTFAIEKTSYEENGIEYPLFTIVDKKDLKLKDVYKAFMQLSNILLGDRYGTSGESISAEEMNLNDTIRRYNIAISYSKAYNFQKSFVSRFGTLKAVKYTEREVVYDNATRKRIFNTRTYNILKDKRRSTRKVRGLINTYVKLSPDNPSTAIKEFFNSQVSFLKSIVAIEDIIRQELEKVKNMSLPLKDEKGNLLDTFDKARKSGNHHHYILKAFDIAVGRILATNTNIYGLQSIVKAQLQKLQDDALANNKPPVKITEDVLMKFYLFEGNANIKPIFDKNIIYKEFNENSPIVHYKDDYKALLELLYVNQTSAFPNALARLTEVRFSPTDIYSMTQNIIASSNKLSSYISGLATVGRFAEGLTAEDTVNSFFTMSKIDDAIKNNMGPFFRDDKYVSDESSITMSDNNRLPLLQSTTHFDEMIDNIIIKDERRLLPHFKTYNYRHNPFIQSIMGKGDNFIFEKTTDYGKYDEYRQSTKSYHDESNGESIERELLFGFLDNDMFGSNAFNYVMYPYPFAHRNLTHGFRVSMIKRDDWDSHILAMAKDTFENNKKQVDMPNFTGAWTVDNIKAYHHKSLMDEVEALTALFFRADLILPNKRDLSKKLEPLLRHVYGGLPEDYNKADYKSYSKGTNNAQAKAVIKELIRAYVYNNYINEYFLMQLIAGSSKSAYDSEGTLIKRLQGASSTGDRVTFGDSSRMAFSIPKPTYRYLVVNDAKRVFLTNDKVQEYENKKKDFQKALSLVIQSKALLGDLDAQIKEAIANDDKESIAALEAQKKMLLSKLSYEELSMQKQGMASMLAYKEGVGMLSLFFDMLQKASKEKEVASLKALKDSEDYNKLDDVAKIAEERDLIQGIRDDYEKSVKELLVSWETNKEEREKPTFDYDSLVTSSNENRAIESTDGAAFMTESRKRELRSGMPENYRFGSIAKMMYYGGHAQTEVVNVYDTKEEADKAKNADKELAPYHRVELINGKYHLLRDKESFMYMKCAHVEITQEMKNRFPALNKLSELLDYMGVGEMVMDSAVKVDTDKASIDYEEIMSLLFDLDNPEASFNFNVGEEKGIDARWTDWKKNNAHKVREGHHRNLRIAFNPNKSLGVLNKNTIANFSQLQFFSNLEVLDYKTAEAIYIALSALQRKGLESIKDKSTKDIILKGLESSPESKYLEALALNNFDVAANTLAGFRKMETVLFSQTFKEAFKKTTNFKGAKMVLQPLIGTEIMYDFETSKWRMKELEYKRDKNGVMYAEVMMPMTFLSNMGLPKSLMERIKKSDNKDEALNSEVFKYMHALGFRLPSTELHSGVIIKIVGFHNGSANTVLAPTALQKIHGSDFDVDSLFTIVRETNFKDIIRRNKEGIITNKKDYLLKENELFGYVLNNNRYELDYNYDTHTSKSLTSLRQYINELKVIAKDIEERRMPTSGENKNDLIKLLESINKDIRDLEKIENSYLRNLIIESSMKAMSETHNADRMITPISESAYKNIEAIYNKNGYIIGKARRNNLRLTHRLESKKNIGVGAKLTGINAQAMKFFSYLKFSSSEFSDLKTYREIQDNYSNKLIELNEAYTSGALTYLDFANELKQMQSEYVTAINEIFKDEAINKDKVISRLKDNNGIDISIDGESYRLSSVRDMTIDGESTWNILDVKTNLSVDNVKVGKIGDLGYSISNMGMSNILTMLGMPLRMEAMLLKNNAFKSLDLFEYNMAVENAVIAMMEDIGQIIEDTQDISDELIYEDIEKFAHVKYDKTFELLRKIGLLEKVFYTDKEKEANRLKEISLLRSEMNTLFDTDSEMKAYFTTQYKIARLIMKLNKINEDNQSLLKVFTPLREDKNLSEEKESLFGIMDDIFVMDKNVMLNLKDYNSYENFAKDALSKDYLLPINPNYSWDINNIMRRIPHLKEALIRNYYAYQQLGNIQIAHHENVKMAIEQEAQRLGFVNLKDKNRITINRKMIKEFKKEFTNFIQSSHVTTLLEPFKQYIISDESSELNSEEVYKSFVIDLITQLKKFDAKFNQSGTNKLLQYMSTEAYRNGKDVNDLNIETIYIGNSLMENIYRGYFSDLNKFSIKSYAFNKNTGRFTFEFENQSNDETAITDHLINYALIFHRLEPREGNYTKLIDSKLLADNFNRYSKFDEIRDNIDNIEYANNLVKFFFLRMIGKRPDLIKTKFSSSEDARIKPVVHAMDKITKSYKDNTVYKTSRYEKDKHDLVLSHLDYRKGELDMNKRSLFIADEYGNNVYINVSNDLAEDGYLPNGNSYYRRLPNLLYYLPSKEELLSNDNIDKNLNIFTNNEIIINYGSGISIKGNSITYKTNIPLDKAIGSKMKNPIFVLIDFNDRSMQTKHIVELQSSKSEDTHYTVEGKLLYSLTPQSQILEMVSELIKVEEATKFC